MNMIEKVARALAFSAGGKFSGPGQNVAAREFGWAGDGRHFEQYAEAHWKEHEHAARFAVEAMRQPTDEMKAVVYWVENSDLPPGWYAMFDAALA